MKFIIFISDNIRQGNFPRVDPFEYSQEHEKYLYKGRELSVTEFNKACARVFHPDFRSQGFHFRPEAFGEDVIQELDAITAAAELAEAQRHAEEAEARRVMEEEAASLASQEEDEAPADPISPESTDEAPEAPEAPASKFHIDGKGIFIGEERVASLYGEEKQLRVVSAYEELRGEIEAWLTTQPDSQP